MILFGPALPGMITPRLRHTKPATSSRRSASLEYGCRTSFGVTALLMGMLPGQLREATDVICTSLNRDDAFKRMTLRELSQP